MSYFHCDCLTQPIYSIARWMIKKGCNTTNVHQKITSECEEDKLEDVNSSKPKIGLPVVASTVQNVKKSLPVQDKKEVKEVAIPLKVRIEIPLPGIRAKVAEIEKSFQDQILLKSEDYKLTLTSTQSSSGNDFTSFKITKQHLGQYYQLFSAKTFSFDEKFNTKGTQLPTEQSPGNLTVSFFESQNLNIFIYSFTLPCSSSYYQKIINDCETQKLLDPNIEQYKTQQIISPNAKVTYIAYKKVLIVSPRDFVMLKYSVDRGIDHWDVGISIPAVQVVNRIRGEVVLSATRVREMENEGRREVEVKVYSEVNMKLSVRPKLTRNQSLTEIRKYVERCLKWIQDNPES